MLTYMGEAPTLPYLISRDRVVNPNNGTITDRTVTPRGELRWCVAVVECPYCDQSHEHPMATVVGWGWFRAECNTLGSLGYYLNRSAP